MENGSSGKLFISHSSEDDAFVGKLRQQLAAHGVDGWIDSRQLRGGDVLWPEIAAAIGQASALLVVVSHSALQSKWVGKELRHALEVQKARQAAGQAYPVVPLSLDGTKLGVLATFFADEVTYISAQSTPGGIEEAINPILVALGLRLPFDPTPPVPIPNEALEELVLQLSDFSMIEQAGKRRASARASLIYHPADPRQPQVHSAQAWRMQAPLGPIEANELHWYLEKYAIWPGSPFATRKQAVEQQLQIWGGLLYEQAFQQPVDATGGVATGAATAPQALASHVTLEVLAAWAKIQPNANRRFSVLVDATPEIGAAPARVAQAREAAAAMLALPWELLHDGSRFLFQGAHATRVRRRLPGTKAHGALQLALPIRILLISARPEDDACGYIDHRLSALPLVEATEALPGQIELHILKEPTYAGLQTELERARHANTPYHVVHFDGHGVYDPVQGLGGLCFEHAGDVGQAGSRRHDLIYTDKLGPLLDHYRIPLVFLEACQSAQAGIATESVATALLKVGVASVVAMSHSVLVETARRFVARFYQTLVKGARVGEAMLAAQQYLAADAVRGTLFGDGEFQLQDWFVPVLYQEQADPPLFTSRPAAQTLEDFQTALAYRLGHTHAAPECGFIGRSRELLAIQRILFAESSARYCVILGQGGEGKTTLACEAARWLVRSQQIRRAVFVSVEVQQNLGAVLDAIGQQLVGKDYSSAQYNNLDQQCQPLERALREQATLLVLDNMESILPPPYLETDPALLEQSAQELQAILAVAQRLLGIGDTRLIFTSREALPAPFAVTATSASPCLALSHLEQDDAVKLIESAIGHQAHGAGEAGKAEVEQIEELAQTVHCHARTLALLAPNLRTQGVAATQAGLLVLMEQMERDFPGEREKSVFASVALSLARLSPDNRQRVRALALFHGGVHLYVLRVMMDWSSEEVADLAQALLQTGLATLGPYNHLTLTPALCPWLRKQLAGDEAAELAGRWQATMLNYVNLLDQQKHQDTELATTLTRLELANLFALLALLANAGDAAATIDLATSLHTLLQTIGKAQLMARVGQVRDSAQAQLGSTWQRAHFEAARTQIEQQLATGQSQAPLAGAHTLLQTALAAGAEAYPGADYDLAMAQCLLGRVLRITGNAKAALALLQQAEQGFATIAQSRDNAASERMAVTCLIEQADCLCNLGQLAAAATAYQAAIARAEQRGAARDVAVGKFQLGTVYFLRKHYPQALAAYEAARTSFAALNEPGSVATSWHHTGMTYAHAGEPNKAEDAYRQSLEIDVRLGNITRQADTLGQLGNLYAIILGRAEDAVVFYRQALEKTMAYGDTAVEGKLRSNLAATLLKLGLWDEAREQIRQAIACKAQFGDAAEPWTSWDILAGIETAAGQTAAAQQARQKACEHYLAYRRAGGENHSCEGRLCADISAMLHADEHEQAQAGLQQLAADPAGANNHPVQALLASLQAIVRGRRDAGLAQDEALHYEDAAEITLLLENLAAKD
jgi:tetratricopeptide (TPR) repeat protein